MAKTDWQPSDTVHPADMNQIGQEINNNKQATENNAQDLAAHEAEEATGAHKATNISLESDNFESNNVKGGMDELFTSVSNGKVVVRDAITDAGGDAPSGGPGDYTFDDLADGVRSVPTSTIESVQRGSVQFSGGDETIPVDISDVDPDKTFVNVNGRSVYGITSDQRAYYIRGHLRDSTSFSLNRRDSSGILEVEWEVVEFSGDVQVSRGVTNMTGTYSSPNAGISDNSKAFLIFSYRTESSIPSGSEVKGYLAGSSIFFGRETSSSGSIQISWYVIEFP